MSPAREFCPKSAMMLFPSLLVTLSLIVLSGFPAAQTKRAVPGGRVTPLAGEKVQKDQSRETLPILPTAIGSALAAVELDAPAVAPMRRLVASIAASLAGEMGLSAFGAWANS